MKVILASVTEDLSSAWRRFCGNFDCVSFHDGSILDADCDAVVSPANSFGFMDGGIDAVYVKYFGSQLQDRARQMIREAHGGEIVVGTADAVETGNSRIPYLIVAPTMRVPMILRETVNPYLAARAVLRFVKFGFLPDGSPVSRRINRIALPGLGTGVGQVSPTVCAHQVAKAIEDVIIGLPEARTWAEASERHQDLYGGRHRRLQHE